MTQSLPLLAPQWLITRIQAHLPNHFHTRDQTDSVKTEDSGYSQHFAIYSIPPKEPEKLRHNIIQLSNLYDVLENKMLLKEWLNAYKVQNRSMFATCFYTIVNLLCTCLNNCFKLKKTMRSYCPRRSASVQPKKPVSLHTADAALPSNDMQRHSQSPMGHTKHS